MPVKLLAKLTVSLGMGTICVFLVVRGMDMGEVVSHLGRVSATAVLLYLATQVFVHLFRAWRWEYLLRPIGISIPLPRLLPISSVGFMAILALPVRLGEFVRPYYVKRMRGGSMSAVLGTVAVERIVDGLLISILFFTSYAVAGTAYPPGLAIGAWVSLIGFVTLTAFLLGALRWRDATVEFALRITLMNRLAPGLAARVGDKARKLIGGFRALADAKNLAPFLVQSVLYWGMNGFGMWVLARQMDLPISIGAAFAAMSFTGVVISLPNPPGNIGAFHLGVKLALLAYLPRAFESRVIAYAIVLHGIQTIWYVGLGLCCLPLTGAHLGLGTVVRESNAAVESEAA